MVRKKAVQSLPTPLVEVVALVDRSFVVGGLGRGGLGLQVGDPNSLMPCCGHVSCQFKYLIFNSYLEERSFNSSSFSVFLAKQKSVTLFWKVTRSCVRSL